VIIGDISGHGLAAAMILTMTSSIMHAMLKEKKPLAIAIEEINHFLKQPLPRHRAHYPVRRHVQQFHPRADLHQRGALCAASHQPGETPALPSRGPLENHRRRPERGLLSSKITLNKNDELVLYTDGAIEIYDEKTDKGFTERDLTELVLKNNRPGHREEDQ
jgi:hypothetical protein